MAKTIRRNVNLKILSMFALLVAVVSGTWLYLSHEFNVRLIRNDSAVLLHSLEGFLSGEENSFMIAGNYLARTWAEESERNEDGEDEAIFNAVNNSIPAKNKVWEDFDVYDFEGDWVAGTSGGDVLGGDFSKTFITKALLGRSEISFSRDEQKLVLIAAVPVRMDSVVEVVLIIKKTLDQGFVTKFSDQFGSDLSLIVNGNLALSSLNIEQQKDLKSSLSEKFGRFDLAREFSVRAQGSILIGRLIKDWRGKYSGLAIAQKSLSSFERFVDRGIQASFILVVIGIVMSMFLSNLISRDIERPLQSLYGFFATRSKDLKFAERLDLAGPVEFEMIKAQVNSFFEKTYEQDKKKEEKNLELSEKIERIHDLLALDDDSARIFSKNIFEFQENFQTIVGSLRENPPERTKWVFEAMRLADSVKSKAKLFGLKFMHYSLDCFEEYLTRIEQQAVVSDSDIDDIKSGFDKIYEEFRSHILLREGLLGRSLGDLSEIKIKRFQYLWLRSIVARLSSKEANYDEVAKESLLQELKELTGTINKSDLRESINMYDQMMFVGASEQGKRVNPIQFSGNYSYFPFSVMERLGDALIHCLRNSLDHGIESQNFRQNVGKPVSGQLSIHCEAQGDRLEITISDDGRGIDCAALSEKFIELGVLTKEDVEKLTPEKILDYVFHPGFTTVQFANDMSGRGVGLEAVRNTMQTLGGDASIRSIPTKGTQIKLTMRLAGNDELATPAGVINLMGDEATDGMFKKYFSNKKNSNIYYFSAIDIDSFESANLKTLLFVVDVNDWESQYQILSLPGQYTRELIFICDSAMTMRQENLFLVEKEPHMICRPFEHAKMMQAIDHLIFFQRPKSENHEFSKKVA